MSRRLWLVLGIAACLVMVGAGVAGARRMNRDPLAELSRYKLQDKTEYVDPSSMAAMMPPGTKVSPYRIRMLSLKEVQLKEAIAVLKRRYPKSEGWQWTPNVAGHEFATAYKLGTGSLHSSSGPMGLVGSMPKDMIMCYGGGLFMQFAKHMPEDGNRPGFTGKETVLITEMHEMTPMETMWLRVSHLGRNPFKEPTDISSFP